MDHEAYKGMLALEALDALGEEDAHTLRTHLATCAECQTELAQLRDAAAMLAYTAAPIRPSGELRSRILESIHVSEQGGRAAATRATNQTNGESKPDKAPSNVLPLPTLAAERSYSSSHAFFAKRSPLVFGALAALLAIAALSVPLVLLWNQNTRMQRELARLSASLSESQTALANTTERLQATQAEVASSGRRTENPVASPEPRTGLSVEGSVGEEARGEIARLSKRNSELQTELARATTRNDLLQSNVDRLSTSNSELQTELTRVSQRSGELQAELARLLKRLGEAQTNLAQVSTRNTELQREVARASSRNNELQTELARVNTRAAELQTEIARQREVEELLAAPGSRIVTLAGTEVAPRARARLIRDRRNERVVFVASDLPSAPAGKAYQLWFIAGSKPLSGGVFTTDAAGRAVLRGQVPTGGRNASTFAVTLEPAGGSNAPTGDKYLLGTSS